MDTTAAIPKMIDAMKSSSRVRLALASRQAILNSQDHCVDVVSSDLFKPQL
ncbi:hypothetical protein NMS_2333 [Nonlabens marinus S1-08]|uniref:Uncharacterized protein n=1 Tax=Nonlabens marinus S1-08 TaxID=1454201 RepID=W8VXQ6_9FLAO|nr:hypothetical protein NMS_2333 [Nonlabens marinus S1-08]